MHRATISPARPLSKLDPRQGHRRPRVREEGGVVSSFAPLSVLGRVPAVESHDYAAQQLVCPVCEFEYVHPDVPFELLSRDEYGGAWDGRGHAVGIPMWCENGHRWTLCLGVHKGYTYMFVSRDYPGSPARRVLDSEGVES
jgi:hypothetical protein